MYAYSSFFTITDEDTSSTNSRSKRYPHLTEALAAAEERLRGGVQAVYILQAIERVTYEKPAPPPLKREKLEASF